MFFKSDRLDDVKHCQYSFQRTCRDGSIHYVGLNHIDLAVGWCQRTTDVGDTVFETVARSQKVRFDIDDKRDFPYHEKRRNAVVTIEVLKRSVQQLYVHATFLVFEMSREIDNIVSFHLVCDNAYTTSSMAAKALAERCIADVREEHRFMVDMSVYSSTSFFRVEGSDKYLTDRRKYILGSSRTSDDMRRGLITYTDGCHTIVYRSPRTPRATSMMGNMIRPLAEINRNTRTVVTGVRPVSVDAISVGTQRLFRGIDYEVRPATGNVIPLDRLRPTMCTACNRMHDHENPYILITREGPKMCCRRSNVHVPINIYESKSDGKEG